jgi:hypothetical protein
VALSSKGEGGMVVCLFVCLFVACWVVERLGLGTVVVWGSIISSVLLRFWVRNAYFKVIFYSH